MAYIICIYTPRLKIISMNKDNIDAFFNSLTPEELKEKWDNYNYLSPPRFVDVNIVASVTKDGSIGNSKDNSLIKTSKEDFKIFRKFTEGNTVIMGRKTWESLPVKPLPNRVNIVVSRTMKNGDGPTFVVPTLEAAINLAYGKIFVIGGAQLYEEALKYFPTLILSVWNDRTLTGDVKFPRWRELIKDYNRKSVKFKKGFNLEIHEHKELR